MFHKKIFFLSLNTFLFISALLLDGCGSGENHVPAFDEKLAWSLCEKAASMIPRHSGTPEAKRQAEFIARTARDFGADVEIDNFKAITPVGELEFNNVIARIQGKSEQYLIIGCHYDAKKLFTSRPFYAANDGASGVGVLLAMIKAIADASVKPYYSLRFVFFDGEECFYEYGENDGLFGSKYYCAKLKASGDLRRCRAVIIADMVGDKDLGITLSPDTPREMSELCFAVADKLGYRKYFSWNKFNIIDDHTPFMQAGVPAIDLIDFQYGQNNFYWHTIQDTLDKMSPESLKIVGEIILKMIYTIK
jgi:glutaminyl-peptide cyclotransferase